jgi:hypothetical protein
MRRGLLLPLAGSAVAFCGRRAGRPPSGFLPTYDIVGQTYDRDSHEPAFRVADSSGQKLLHNLYNILRAGGIKGIVYRRIRVIRKLR